MIVVKKEFDELYLNKAVWCKTEELANEFLELADSMGYKWLSGERPTEYNLWEKYKEETYYTVDNKVFKDAILCGNKGTLMMDDPIVEFKSLKENKQQSQEILANKQTMFELRCEIERLKQKVLNQKIEINDLKAELYDIYKNR